MDQQNTGRDHQSLWQIFIRDSRNFMETLDTSVPELSASNEQQPDIISRIFRALHSLKSEADFLEIDDVAAAADSVEDALSELKSGGDPSEVERRYAGLRDILNKKLKKRGIGFRSLTKLESERTEEALERKEQLYTVRYTAAEDEEVPSARLYLALDRLERIRNVIAVEPAAEKLEEANLRSITILFSQGGKIPNDDEMPQVDRLDMAGPLFYDPHAPSDQYQGVEGDNPDDTVQTAPIPIEGGRRGYLAEDFQKTLFLTASLIQKTTFLEGTIRERTVRNIFGLDTHLCGREKIQLQPVFDELLDRGKRMAAEAGKNIRFTFSGKSVAVFPPIAELLTEIIIHLLKNCIVHGIESPENRKELNKNPEGSVEIGIIRKNGIDTISVKDDGRGISEKEVREASGNRDSPVLDIIAAPGFTTRPKTERNSGRGVGLDTVRHTVERLMGGKLVMRTEPGRGTGFFISIPADLRPVRFIVCRNGNAFLAVPAFGIKKSELTDHSRAKEYAVENRLRVSGSESKGSEGKVLMIHYADGASEFLLLSDSLVSEEVSIISPLRKTKVYSQTARKPALIVPPLKGI
ncbi:MAG: ATP-binding protein [Spirochaetia bacterium]